MSIKDLRKKKNLVTEIILKAQSLDINNAKKEANEQYIQCIKIISNQLLDLQTYEINENINKYINSTINLIEHCGERIKFISNNLLLEKQNSVESLQNTNSNNENEEFIENKENINTENGNIELIEKNYDRIKKFNDNFINDSTENVNENDENENENEGEEQEIKNEDEEGDSNDEVGNTNINIDDNSENDGNNEENESEDENDNNENEIENEVENENNENEIEAENENENEAENADNEIELETEVENENEAKNGDNENEAENDDNEIEIENEVENGDNENEIENEVENENEAENEMETETENGDNENEIENEVENENENNNENENENEVKNENENNNENENENENNNENVNENENENNNENENENENENDNDNTLNVSDNGNDNINIVQNENDNDNDYDEDEDDYYNEEFSDLSENDYLELLDINNFNEKTENINDNEENNTNINKENSNSKSQNNEDHPSFLTISNLKRHSNTVYKMPTVNNYNMPTTKYQNNTNNTIQRNQTCANCNYSSSFKDSSYNKANLSQSKTISSYPNNKRSNNYNNNYNYNSQSNNNSGSSQINGMPMPNGSTQLNNTMSMSSGSFRSPSQYVGNRPRTNNMSRNQKLNNRMSMPCYSFGSLSSQYNGNMSMFNNTPGSPDMSMSNYSSPQYNNNMPGSPNMSMSNNRQSQYNNNMPMPNNIQCSPSMSMPNSLQSQYINNMPMPNTPGSPDMSMSNYSSSQYNNNMPGSPNMSMISNRQSQYNNNMPMPNTPGSPNMSMSNSMQSQYNNNMPMPGSPKFNGNISMSSTISGSGSSQFSGISNSSNNNNSINYRMTYSGGNNMNRYNNNYQDMNMNNEQSKMGDRYMMNNERNNSSNNMQMPQPNMLPVPMQMPMPKSAPVIDFNEYQMPTNISSPLIIQAQQRNCQIWKNYQQIQNNGITVSSSLTLSLLRLMTENLSTARQNSQTFTEKILNEKKEQEMIEEEEKIMKKVEPDIIMCGPSRLSRFDEKFASKLDSEKVCDNDKNETIKPITKKLSSSEQIPKIISKIEKKPSQKRNKTIINNLITELYTTECSFIERLNVLIHSIKKKILKENLIPKNAVDVIFFGIEEIQNFSMILQNEFKLAIDNTEEEKVKAIGNVFLKHFGDFNCYVNYISNYSKSTITMKSYMKSKEEFNQFINSVHTMKECERQDINSFFILPIQHATRYSLLLSALYKRNKCDECIETAMNYMKEIAKTLDQVQRKEEEINGFFVIYNETLNCPKTLYKTPDSIPKRLIKTYIAYIGNKNQVNVHILNDSIMITKNRRVSQINRYKYKFKYYIEYSSLLMKKSNNNSSRKIGIYVKKDKNLNSNNVITKTGNIISKTSQRINNIYYSKNQKENEEFVCVLKFNDGKMANEFIIVIKELSEKNKLLYSKKEDINNNEKSLNSQKNKIKNQSTDDTLVENSRSNSINESRNTIDGEDSETY